MLATKAGRFISVCA